MVQNGREKKKCYMTNLSLVEGRQRTQKKWQYDTFKAKEKNRRELETGLAHMRSEMFSGMESCLMCNWIHLVTAHVLCGAHVFTWLRVASVWFCCSFSAVPPLLQSAVLKKLLSRLYPVQHYCLLSSLSRGNSLTCRSAISESGMIACWEGSSNWMQP